VGLGNAVTPDGENIIRMIRVGVWGGYQGYPELAYRAEVYAASVGKGGLLSFITTFHAN